MIIEDPSSAVSKQKTLNAYDRVSKKAGALLAKQLVLWWQKVVMDAKAACLAYGAYDTGALYESIRTITRDDAGELGQHWEKVVDINPMLDRVLVAGGAPYINPKTKKIVDYAQAVHDGHVTSGGNYVSRRPFLTDAVTANLPDLHKLLEAWGIDLGNEWLKDP